MTEQPTPNASDGRCERCGADASVFVCEATCGTASGGGASCESTCRAYCRACAKTLGEYPGFFARTFGFLGFLVTLPLLPFFMLKYPRSYWRKKFAEIEARKQGR